MGNIVVAQRLEPSEEAPVLLGALPREAARRSGRHLAVEAAGTALTYEELDARVDAIAALLAGLLGTGRREVVAVSSVLGADFPAVYYAVARAGHIVAPVNPFLPPPVWQGLLGSVGAAAVVLAADVQAKVGPALAAVPSLRAVVTFEELPHATEDAYESVPAGPDDIAAIMFTSGSTGRPKGVALTHRNLLTGARQIGAAHGVGADAVVLNALPLYHPMHLNAAVTAGATQLLAAGPDPLGAVRLARERRATHFYALPFQLAGLAEHPEPEALALPDVRLVGTGGLPLPPATADRLTASFGAPLVQGYGLTETAGLAHSAGAAGAPEGSVGPALPEAATRIVDLTTREPVTDGGLGEIEITGPHVALGYVSPDGEGRLAVRPAAGPDGWFATGDAGRLSPEGDLYVLDRVVDLYHHAGALVSPGRVERRLAADPAVRECAVLGLPAPGTDGPLLTTAFVAVRDGAEDTWVERLTAEEGPGAERVHRVVPVGALPRLPNGKLDKAALRELGARTAEAAVSA
ncbi:class I adenylate-forming enzyme family protein [Streptomyces stackebrandtii]|uniref:class I adenylate-forming enzyme family protein n=1 Tax=Streptomyces stackebrandtii TaxID=3051177 RepID=UPI0028DBFAE2|nr:class I adenylate-forming enzyme family protein [Streptomyces sp. DSM 40976]